MAIQKILIAEFIELSQHYPVLDVRSPAEYQQAHIPGAYSLPLFTDEERKVVGTAYKQESREAAIKAGLDYFGIKMKNMIEEVESLTADNTKTVKGEPGHKKNVMVHCWRGGMRSEGVAWLLDLYGFKVYTLIGGYKAYRRWTRAQFQKKYNFMILSGFTGAGKTLVIHELKRTGKIAIDLEGLANHKGSAFGAFGQQPQPSQEMFENLLASELFEASLRLIPAQKSASSPVVATGNIYIEDESRRIGNLTIPNDLWDTLQLSATCFIDIPFEKRLDHITLQYGEFEKESIINAILRIQKRMGGQETRTAINHLQENNFSACFRVLLKYYDKCYGKTMLKRENVPPLLNKVSCTSVDVKTIINLLINERAAAS